MHLSKLENIGRLIRRPYQEHPGISHFKVTAVFRSLADSAALLE
jgi:DNA-binding HxlR family transcriptional regulator